MSLSWKLTAIILLMNYCSDAQPMIIDKSEDESTQHLILEYDSTYTLDVGKEYTLSDGKKFLIASAHRGRTLGCFGSQPYKRIDWFVNGIKNRVEPKRPNPMARESDYGTVRNIRLQVISWNYLEEDKKRSDQVRDSLKNAKHIEIVNNLAKFKTRAKSIKLKIIQSGPWSGFRYSK